jgi:ribonuclease R
VQAFGLFVQLDAWFVDGLVPVRTMADDFYVHEPETHSLVGQELGRAFQLAQPVEVELVGIDERRRGLQLKIAGMPEPRRSTPAAARGPRGRGHAGESGSSKRPRGARYDRRK